ncbi:hypothetical protein GMRT_14942 [Giardia muris]|uniref:Uncharacterized protein n=1 Tax=Giardia muris TaxID=5742 RepID=A0A4Z1STF5_GIAMU|nr:hypothetical protein GMRT_14942 [Giardia muris]|eukprot:TNJ29174.1 hypothetical protein GMRT_14942 [Giardia muris]
MPSTKGRKRKLPKASVRLILSGYPDPYILKVDSSIKQNHRLRLEEISLPLHQSKGSSECFEEKQELGGASAIGPWSPKAEDDFLHIVSIYGPGTCDKKLVYQELKREYPDLQLGQVQTKLYMLRLTLCRIRHRRNWRELRPEDLKGLTRLDIWPKVRASRLTKKDGGEEGRMKKEGSPQ